MATTSSQATSPRRNGAGLVRDLDLLEVLASPEAQREDGLRVLRIAELAGRDKAAVSRALATLADAGLLARDADRATYRLGRGLFALAARTSEAALVHRCRPMLRQVVAAARETAHLCVLSGGRVLTLASETSPREVGTAGWAGLSTPALRTPSGRVLLSDYSRPALETWWAAYGDADASGDRGAGAPLERPGPFPVLPEPSASGGRAPDIAAVVAELARVRRQGYALSLEELESGVVAASAPVRDHTGVVVAALNLSAPAARLRSRVEDLGAYVATCAANLSLELGHRRDVGTL